MIIYSESLQVLKAYLGRDETSTFQQDIQETRQNINSFKQWQERQQKKNTSPCNPFPVAMEPLIYTVTLRLGSNAFLYSFFSLAVNPLIIQI